MRASAGGGKEGQMGRWLACAAALLTAIQEKGQNPDLKYSQTWGVSVMRPPKPRNEEWDLKDTGVKFQAQLSVSHKVDEVSVEFLIQEPAGGMSYYDPKEAAEGLFMSLSASQNLKDGKKRGKVKASKLPGNAASGVQAWYLEMEFKDHDNKLIEFRTWSFIGKENRCLYRIVLVTAEGMYAKYQKEILYILSSVRTYKIK